MIKFFKKVQNLGVAEGGVEDKEKRKYTENLNQIIRDK